jgi:hypothetical protein
MTLALHEADEVINGAAVVARCASITESNRLVLIAATDPFELLRVKRVGI